jgi:hypothetical protein
LANKTVIQSFSFLRVFLFITNDFGWDEFSDLAQGMSAFPNQWLHSSKPEAPSRATWLYEVCLRKEIARQLCPAFLPQNMRLFSTETIGRCKFHLENDVSFSSRIGAA